MTLLWAIIACMVLVDQGYVCCRQWWGLGFTLILGIGSVTINVGVVYMPGLQAWLSGVASVTWVADGCFGLWSWLE